MRLNSMLGARMHFLWMIWTTFGGLVCLGANARGQCDEASEGFYLPSLQTLIMMPLSQAGDRLEARWAGYRDSFKASSFKPTSIREPRVQCDELDEPSRWVQPIGVRPSYDLQDGSIFADSALGNSLSEHSLSGGLDSGSASELLNEKDERLAKELSEPVRFKRPDSRPETLAVLALEPVPHLGTQPEVSQASAVRFVSGTSQVRATGVRDSRAGEIRDRHQQRKRAENFGPKFSGHR